MADEMYNVVLQYTREVEGYEGVRTWTSFRDKANFNEWCTQDIKKRQSAIAQGVTQNEAIEISRKTPLSYDFAVCLQKATSPETREINKKILEIELETMLLVRSYRK